MRNFAKVTDAMKLGKCRSFRAAFKCALRAVFAFTDLVALAWTPLFAQLSASIYIWFVDSWKDKKSENDQHSCRGEEDGGIITEQSNFSVPEYMTADEIMTALKEAEPLRKEERKTSNLAEKCLLILHSIEEKLKNCRGEEHLRSCYRHLRNAENSLDIEFDADFPEIDEETAAEPANKKMALQRPSVKKPFLKRLKQKVLSQKLRPPSGAERSTVKMTLEGLFLTDKVKLSERDESNYTYRSCIFCDKLRSRSHDAFLLSSRSSTAEENWRKSFSDRCFINRQIPRGPCLRRKCATKQP